MSAEGTGGVDALRTSRALPTARLDPALPPDAPRGHNGVEHETAFLWHTPREGRHFTSSGAHSYWPATGSIDGDVVTLGGVVSDSNTPFLVGSPVEVEADSTTGAMTFRLGPQAGGPFVGQTIVFTGVGTVKIKTS